MNNSRIKKYNYIYCLFFFCACILSTQKMLMSLTPRQLFAVIMFFVCLRVEGNKIWCDKLFGFYVVFVICYGISSLLTGYFSEFLLRLIGDYFVAYVGLWSIRLLISKNNDVEWFLYTIIFIGLFDGIVTALQFLGIPYLDTFLNRLHLVSYTPYLNIYQGSGEALLSRCVPGIFSHPVLNAHALAATTVISTYIACKKNHILGIILTLLMIIFLFCTQQRTAFAIGLLSVLAIVIISARQSKLRFISIPALIIIFTYFGFLFYGFISKGDFRFSEIGMDSGGRDYIYKYCRDFIKANPLGGINSFVAATGVYPHNLFFNAFIFGGWIGGTVIIGMVFFQLVQCYKSIINKHVDITEKILALAVFSLIVNGITHNQSIVNGEIITWTIWGAFYYTKQSMANTRKQQLYLKTSVE